MNGTSALPHPIMLTLSGVGACAGAVALLTYFTVYAVLPARMERVEETNKAQDHKIAEMQADNAQRREILASVLATVQQIDKRTQTIETHILK